MLCDEADIPWQDIAFRSVDFALRRYLDDRRRGVEQHHFTSIDLRGARATLMHARFAARPRFGTIRAPRPPRARAVS